jgi:hypothetical protein
MLQFYQMMNSVQFVMHIPSHLPSDLVTINRAGICYTDACCHCFIVAFSRLHAVTSFSSVSVSVKIICVLPLTFLLCMGLLATGAIHVYLSKPGQVPPSLPPLLLYI